MTRRRTTRDILRDAMLNQEQDLYDLRAALAALTVMASAPNGIETDDMAGLYLVARSARDLAGSLHHVWRDTIEHLNPRGRSEA